jgi:membrane peptidoglycan carboxypeptidase
MLIAAALTVTMAIPLTVFAATSDAPAAKSVRGFFNRNAADFTDQQKADAKEYSQKMLDLRKEYINKMVANGTITQEQADAAIKKLDELGQKAEQNGWVPGFDKAFDKAREFFKGGRGDSESKGFSGIQLW